MDAAAEQELRAARHQAAEREASAEAKQLRAEVRRLAHQLTSIKRGLRCAAAWAPCRGACRVAKPSAHELDRTQASISAQSELVCRDEADVDVSPEASQPFTKQVSMVCLAGSAVAAPLQAHHHRATIYSSLGRQAQPSGACLQPGRHQKRNVPHAGRSGPSSPRRSARRAPCHASCRAASAACVRTHAPFAPRLLLLRGAGARSAVSWPAGQACATAGRIQSLWCCRPDAEQAERRIRELENEVAALQLELQCRPTLQHHRALQRQLHSLKRSHGAHQVAIMACVQTVHTLSVVPLWDTPESASCWALLQCRCCHHRLSMLPGWIRL